MLISFLYHFSYHNIVCDLLNIYKLNSLKICILITRLCRTNTFDSILAGGPKKEAEEEDGVEPEAPEPFEWPDDI